jgi:hypothetical protein
MKPLPIDKLVIKGTHNSYVCNSGGWWSMTPPWMNHPPEQQIDDFGIWVIELDVGIVMEDGQPKVAVGHNGPGHATCWGRRLKEDYLDKIAKTQALRYRPVLIGFDPKTHEQQEDWPNLGWTAQEISAKAEAVLEEVFGRENIMNGENLNDFLQQYSRYPTMPELAGKAVMNIPNDTHADECTYREAVEKSIKSGIGLYEGESCKGGCRIFRIDQYQADWTFEYGIPPNPLVVDAAADPPWAVLDSVGEDWGCDNGDVWKGQVVHEQGTYRFPFKTLRAAVTRTEGVIDPNEPQDLERNELRSGYGWTVLLRSGHYPEKITINIPLTLKKDDDVQYRNSGNVVIGR